MKGSTRRVEPFMFKGDAGTPIKYEEIVPWRDIVFLVRNLHYDEEDKSRGAPASGTLCYPGYIRKKDGLFFIMTCFLTAVADGHLEPIRGTRVLFDGGVSTQHLTYDPRYMCFWKTGEQYATTENPTRRAGEP